MPQTYFTEQHDIFRKTFRDFVERELRPNATEWEQERLFPRSVFDRMGELGFFGASFPEEVGGAGGDWWYTAVYAEELTRSVFRQRRI